MRFEVTVALRYLRSSGLQTFLVLAGVAMGVIAYTFIAALINGLQDRILEQVLGNSPHVTLEPPEREPGLVQAPPGYTVLLGAWAAGVRRPQILGWQTHLAVVERTPGVTVASPQAFGSGFIQRAQRTEPISLVGVEPDRISAIVDVAGGLTRGSVELGPDDMVVGSDLADNLTADVGQRLLVRSETGGERSFRVRGIFDIGAAGLNERLVFVDLAAAQALLGLEGGISRIEVKVADIDAAPRIGSWLAEVTGLQGTDWVEQNRQLREALRAQSATGNLIKAFSVVTITIGVAGVLVVAALRRRSEVGILRSMGVTRRSITAIFVLQGFFVGAFGSLVGSAVGWVFLSVLREATLRPDGTPAIPVDPGQGEYGLVIVLAVLASSVAAIGPARSAARTDPVEVLQQ